MRRVNSLTILLLCSLIPELMVARGSSLSGYEYLSPIPFSPGHNPETGITIRYGEELERNTLDQSLFIVSGDISGPHQPEINFADDCKTLILKFERPFALNERVRIRVKEGARTTSGKTLTALDYWFYIRGWKHELADTNPDKSSAVQSPVILETVQSDSLLPQIKVTTRKDPSRGYVFCDLKGKPSGYLYAFDNYGTPVFYKRFSGEVKNFRPHPGGFLTYYDTQLKVYIKLDRFYQPVDTFRMGNGYQADMHEFVLLENNHVLMLAYDIRIMDLSQVFPGGETDAQVTGFVIQELDSEGMVIFQWRSWDHFSVTDTYMDCSVSVCDFAHANSIDMDSDTSLLISTRNMSEVTKINRLTGSIIWRMGGKNNQFIFSDDSGVFSGQHTVLRQKDGTITMFDNGTQPLISRGLVYEVDEIERKVRLVREIRHDPDIYGYVRGNMEVLSNGNFLIYWGTFLNQTSGPFSEYNPEGELVFEAEFKKILFPPYRCHRAVWNHQVFTLGADSITFEQHSGDQPGIRSIEVTNNSGDSIFITSLLSHSGKFSITEDLPAGIAAGEKRVLSIAFTADTAGQYSDLLTVCYDTDTSRVSQQLTVTATADFQTGVEGESMPGLSIYPNPMIHTATICFPNPDLYPHHLTIRDLSGKTIRTEYNIRGTKIEISRNDLKQGYYIVEISGIQTYRGNLLVY